MDDATPDPSHVFFGRPVGTGTILPHGSDVIPAKAGIHAFYSTVAMRRA
jgi:hypothetical protein